jgi:hypothetical protein
METLMSGRFRILSWQVLMPLEVAATGLLAQVSAADHAPLSNIYSGN